MDLLKKSDYNINKSNIKYFLKDLYKQQQKEDLLIQEQIKKIFSDIEDMKKLEQIERLEQIRKSEINR